MENPAAALFTTYCRVLEIDARWEDQPGDVRSAWWNVFYEAYDIMKEVEYRERPVSHMPGRHDTHERDQDEMS